jgi:DNA mismatch repair protein MutL
MARIERLSPTLANQIAAGEVVERPASVVKELVENALDASATKVRVEVSHGGLSRIVVVDDGVGMDEADARLCFERHATSKLSEFEDLQRLTTYGFRGEALPSIASVAKVKLVTRSRGVTEGVQVTIHGGADPIVVPAGAAEGTSVTIDDLFFNVPARRKFAKSQGAESAQVGEVVLLAALSRPDVSFTLVRDQRLAREYLRSSFRKGRVAQVFDEPLELNVGERGSLRFEAYLSSPERARSGANALYFFVNGRPVRDRTLARAVAQAYGSVLEPGRYPLGVVYIELPAELVDVNVHPQKAEVRFAEGRAVADRLCRELNRSLGQVFALPAFNVTNTDRFQPSFQPATSYGSQDKTPAQVSPQVASLAEPAQLRFTSERREPDAAFFAQAGAASDPSGASDVKPTAKERAGFYANLRFVGQVRAMFLLCEGEDGLYILDQHAAAERVTFHRLKTAYRARTVATQQLLIPTVVQVTALEASLIDDQHEAVLQMGLDVTRVGETGVVVRAVPKVLERAVPERLVRDLLAEIGFDAKRPFSDAVDLVLATMACHGSIRAGDLVHPDEVAALLSSLDQVDFAGHCPHGRPVVTRMSFDELERKVAR